MEISEAIKYIVDHWEELHKKQNGSHFYSHPKTIAVWCATSDIAGSYEVDEEWIGVTPQGNIAWAYASGCSCWNGDYTEETKSTIKELILDHKHTPEDWEKAIVTFVETQEIQNLPRYDRYGDN